MSDDLLARIDQVTEEWDTWDGDSADAMRWTPDLPERGTGLARVTFAGRDLDAYVVSVQPAVQEWAAQVQVLWADLIQAMARALVPLVDAVILAHEQATNAAEAVRGYTEVIRRPSHTPPMWADVPTKQRRRR